MARTTHPRLTMAKVKFEVTVALGEQCPQLDWRTRYDLVDYLQRASAILHTRYENACSYAWASTEQYERQTASREACILATLREHGLADCAEFQTDPRGWPLVLRLNGREYRLGGKLS